MRFVNRKTDKQSPNCDWTMIEMFNKYVMPPRKKRGSMNDT